MSDRKVGDPTRGNDVGQRRECVTWSVIGLVCAVSLPAGWILLNETIHWLWGGGVAAEFRSDPGAWLSQSARPPVQRPFYPFLCWSMAAYGAFARGLRAQWVGLGLAGGVLSGGAFLAGYSWHIVPAIVDQLYPEAVVLACALVLGSFAVISSYGLALRSYTRTPGADQELEARVDQPYVTRALWGMMGFGASSVAIMRMNAYWASLPDPPKDCFVATAAANGVAFCSRGSLIANRANQRPTVARQVRVLKAAEIVFAALFPRGHRRTRAVYDRIGPKLAERLGPATSLLVSVGLYPIQFVLEFLLAVLFRDVESLVAGTYKKQPWRQSAVGSHKALQ